MFLQQLVQPDLTVGLKVNRQKAHHTHTSNMAAKSKLYDFIQSCQGSGVVVRGLGSWSGVMVEVGGRS